MCLYIRVFVCLCLCVHSPVVMLCYVQISGREMFEFNPELIEGDDDEADEVAYQHETHDDVRTLNVYTDTGVLCM